MIFKLIKTNNFWVTSAARLILLFLWFLLPKMMTRTLEESIWRDSNLIYLTFNKISLPSYRDRLKKTFSC
jgi:hypothetical protein